MDVSLYQAAAAMNATQRWQDMIAENLSASAVPGSRKQEISFSDVQAGLASGLPGSESAAFYLPVASSVTSFKAGELKATGNPMDFALEGSAFFTVKLPNGETGYTRNGEFRMGSRGQVVTKEGYPVMGAGGALQANPNDSHQITISATGDVSQGAQPLGKIQLAEFSDTNQLTPSAPGYFENSNPDVKPVPSTTTSVRQGFVEAANTSPTTEMSGLITAMRMFETNQKVLQMQSDRMSKVISDLGGTGQT